MRHITTAIFLHSGTCIPLKGGQGQVVLDVGQQHALQEVSGRRTVRDMCRYSGAAPPFQHYYSGGIYLGKISGLALASKLVYMLILR